MNVNNRDHLGVSDTNTKLEFYPTLISWHLCMFTFWYNYYKDVGFSLVFSHVIVCTAGVFFCFLCHFLRCNFQRSSILNGVGGIICLADPGINVWWIGICWAVKPDCFAFIKCKYSPYLLAFVGVDGKPVGSIFMYRMAMEREGEKTNSIWQLTAMMSNLFLFHIILHFESYPKEAGC